MAKCEKARLGRETKQYKSIQGDGIHEILMPIIDCLIVLEHVEI